MNQEISPIASLLIEWYQKNKRELPWRETTNPYLIWISEIILQQTRVAQGLDYYLRFINRFPDVKSLAKTDEDEVLTYWQGLGYYSRARNLHAAAKAIVENYQGIFPNKFEEILSLKGVGEYTASAIVSFAYNQSYAVVDGNVFRVLSRLFGVEQPIDTGVGKKIFTQLAQEVMDKEHPAIYNQAIMEFGALQCVPVNPHCENCPLKDKCVALQMGKVSELPKKQGKIKVQNRYFNYFDIRFQNKLFIRKRTKEDIWKNLYELPLLETSEPLSLEELMQTTDFVKLFPIRVEIRSVPLEFKHVLSHRIIYAKFYSVEISEIPSSLLGDYVQISMDELPNYAISRLVSRYFEKK